VTVSVTNSAIKASESIQKEADMRDFTITEDFLKNEIEFDQRFSDPKAWYHYLSDKNGPMALSVVNAVMTNTGSVHAICIFAKTVNSIIH